MSLLKKGKQKKNVKYKKEPMMTRGKKHVSPQPFVAHASITQNIYFLCADKVLYIFDETLFSLSLSPLGTRLQIEM